VTHKTAPEIIRMIDGLISKWRVHFPNEDSEVEISRRHLLTLVESARASETRLAACQAALAIEEQIGPHDTIKGPNERLIAQLRAAIEGEK
jgi:hypothetical protein